MPKTAKATKKKKATKKVSLKDRLSKLKKGKSTSKKSDKPEITLTCGHDLYEYSQAMKAEKAAKAAKATHGEIIAEEAEEHIVSESRKKGEALSSIKVVGKTKIPSEDNTKEEVEKTVKLTYIAPGNRYCQILLDQEPQIEGLREIFGEETFEEYFEEGHEVKINANLDDELLEDLVALCEKRKVDFEDLFSVKSVLVPTEKFTRDRVMEEDVRSKFEKAKAEGFIKPFKATIR